MPGKIGNNVPANVVVSYGISTIPNAARGTPMTIESMWTRLIP